VVTMPNEIQQIYFGSQASPIASTEIEAGTFTITFDGQTTGAIACDADAAAITAALESLSNIGVGDVAVTLTSNGFTVEFQGALANTSVVALTVDQSLKRKADTITITETQAGIADVPTNPSNSTTTAAVSPVDAQQGCGFGGATTGYFTMSCSGYGSANVSSMDDSGLQSACNTVFGSGNVSVSSGILTFTAGLAGTPIPAITVIDNQTDGSPGFFAQTTGVAGVHQVDTCTFSAGSAVSGSFTWDGSTTSHSSTPASGMGNSISGSASAGTITTTWSDYGSHTPYAVANVDLLAQAGRPHVFTITLNDAPTEGEFKLTLNTMLTSSAIPYGSSSSAVASAANELTSEDWSGSGSDGGPWTLTSLVNMADPGTFTGADDTPLRKALASVQVVTVQEGAESDQFAGEPQCGLGCGLGL